MGEEWDMLEGIGIRLSSGLEEEHCDLPHVEVDEMLGLMCDVGSEVPADHAVPGGVVLLVELLLDVGGNVLLDVELLQGHVGTIDRVLLHLLVHIRVLNHCLTLRRRHYQLNQINPNARRDTQIGRGAARWMRSEGEGFPEGMGVHGVKMGCFSKGVEMGIWGVVVLSTFAGGCGIVAGVSGSLCLPAVEFQLLLLQVPLHFNRHDATIAELQLCGGGGEDVGSGEELGLRRWVERETTFGVGDVGTEGEVEVARVPSREVVVLEPVDFRRDVLQLAREETLGEEETVEDVLGVLLVHEISDYTIKPLQSAITSHFKTIISINIVKALGMLHVPIPFLDYTRMTLHPFLSQSFPSSFPYISKLMIWYACDHIVAHLAKNCPSCISVVRPSSTLFFSSATYFNISNSFSRLNSSSILSSTLWIVPTMSNTEYPCSQISCILFTASWMRFPSASFRMVLISSIDGASQMWSTSYSVMVWP